MPLEKLKQVDLRTLWPDEEKNFTPWLSGKDGLALLGEALGMELELEDTEVFVGNYRADIVAKDTLSDCYVVIENQLSPTDHDHIGKLLTYAASFDAKTIVWIAQNIREEHRQAIDWLNSITVKDTDFFGIEIELLQIGDSPYAPNLKIVSKPNEWTRSIRGPKTVTPGDNLKYEFWTAFNEYIKQNKINISVRTPSTQHWYDVTIGKGGVHLSLTLRPSMKDLGCEVYIGSENAKALFKYLQDDKEAIEKIVGGCLEWNELPEGKASRIILRQSIDPNIREKWDDCFKWYEDSVSKFREAFVPRIKKFYSMV